MKIIEIKPKLFVIAMFLSICLNTHAQTIRYSRNIIRLPDCNLMQLIPDISKNHHLLLFRKNASFIVYRFDKELQFLEKKELPVNYTDTCETKVISFKDFYYLYQHKRGSYVYKLWKVNAQGDVTSLSEPFQNFIDTAFEKISSGLQLSKKDEQLVIVANSYSGERKVETITVTRVDDHFKTVHSRSVSFPMEQRLNRLRQMMLVGDNLFILKALRNAQNYALELIKSDLTTGKLFIKAFDCNEHFAQNARLQYFETDSSIFIQSAVGEYVFISKLDLSLKEMVPASLVKPRFSNDVSTNFLLLNENVQQWVTLSRLGLRFNYQSSNYSDVPYWVRDKEPRYSSPGGGNYSIDDYNRQMYGQSLTTLRSNVTNSYPRTMRYVGSDVESSPIRFSVVDKDFKVLKDSLITNKNSTTVLNAGKFANFMAGNKSYLILKQNLPRKRKGLLLVTVDRSSNISTSDITVFEKYEYLLQFAQSIKNNTLLMPYVEHSKVGLVKLTFDNLEN